MTATRLKLIYDLISKYEKLKWEVKSPQTVLGKPVTFIYEVVNFLKYGSLDLTLIEAKMTKDVAKFFGSIYDVYEVNLEDSEFATNIYDEIYDEIHEEIGDLFNSCNTDERKYIISIFYTNGKLNQWKTIEKNFDFNNDSNKSASVKLSSQYTAIIKKNQPIEVGCQRIDIDKIRKIVEEYDNLNKPQ